MKSKRSVGPKSSALQLARSISKSVERNVVEEIDLHQACKDGMIDAVSALLSDGSRDLNAIDSLGLTPLHHAAKHNRYDVTQLLVDYGADPNLFNQYDTRKFTPLQLACWFDSTATVRVLIGVGSDVSMTSPLGHKAIHCAAARSGVEIAQELLFLGRVDPNAKDNVGFTALHVAANRGRAKVIEVLLRNGADLTIQDNDGNTPAHIAARDGHVTTLRTLLQSAKLSGVSMRYVLDSTGTGSCLQLAVKKCNLEAAKVCLEFGADTSPNLHDNSPPLHTACIYGNLELVELLVASGASLEAEDIEGMTPILRACLSGKVDLVNYLIDQGASLEAELDCPSPLMCAVKRGHSDVIRLLLGRGSSITVRDAFDRTCLHVAVYSDNKETLDILLEMISKLLCSGADANLSDEEEKLPVHHAAETGELRCFRALVAALPESIHQADYRLRTPLFYAAIEDHKEIVKYLIEKGAHVNVRDDDRMTPLLAVSRECSVDVVDILLKHGANIDALSKNRASPLLVASFHGNKPTVKILLDNGAKVDSKSIFGLGCLCTAINGKKEDVCMEIIKHKRWREVLKIKSSEGFTGMKDLIEQYPDVAKVAMDKCISPSNHPTTDENYSITYNFEFLNVHPDTRTNSDGKIYFGPQSILKSGRRELLFHPLTKELIMFKWNILGRYKMLFSLATYILFVVNLTMFMVCFGQINLKSGERISDASYKMCRPDVMAYQSLAVGSFSGLWLVVHVFRAFREKWNYVNSNAVLEVVLFSTCLSASLMHDKEFQFSWGICSLLLCYTTLLFYLQTIFDSGIYVTMMFVVLKSMLKVMAMFVILLLAFALIFHLLLNSADKQGESFQTSYNTTIVLRHPFHDLLTSMVKVTAMVIGELDYTRYFVEQQNAIPQLAVIIFVCFCILLPIVLMNLLIGLAVGDIDKVQKNAEIRLLAMKIQAIYALEQQLPAAILRYFYKPQIVKYPNRPDNCRWRALKVVSNKLAGGSADQDDVTEDPDQAQLESLEELATRLSSKMDEHDQRMDQLVSDVEKQRTTLDKIARALFTDSDSRL